jgi:predicted nucleic acid-binding protein
LIAVDSSVWIDGFRGTETRQVKALIQLLRVAVAVRVPEVVLTEVLRGARDDREEAMMSDSLLAFPSLPLAGPGDFIEAARLSRIARGAGFTVASTVDLLIAAACIREDMPLLHADADFDRLASCTPLRIFGPG